MVLIYQGTCMLLVVVVCSDCKSIAAGRLVVKKRLTSLSQMFYWFLHYISAWRGKAFIQGLDLVGFVGLILVEYRTYLRYDSICRNEDERQYDCYILTIIFVDTKLKGTSRYIRNKYNIPERQGQVAKTAVVRVGGWWTCCTVSQIAKHTTDYETYGGDENTLLRPYFPPLRTSLPKDSRNNYHVSNTAGPLKKRALFNGAFSNDGMGRGWSVSCVLRQSYLHAESVSGWIRQTLLLNIRRDKLVWLSLCWSIATKIRCSVEDVA